MSNICLNISYQEKLTFKEFFSKSAFRELQLTQVLQGYIYPTLKILDYWIWTSQKLKMGKFSSASFNYVFIDLSIVKVLFSKNEVTF